MSRILLAAVVFGILLSLAPAAPIPKGREKPDLYYPTAVGTRCVYAWVNGVEFTTVITEAREKNGVTVVTVMLLPKTERAADHYETVAVSHTGLSYLTVGTSRCEPAPCWLKIPAKVGDIWETDILRAYPGDSGTVAGRATVRGVEKIEVPAGTFETLRVDGRGQETSGKWVDEQRWYAPGVGLVKCVNGEGNELVLKSFTPGK